MFCHGYYVNGCTKPHHKNHQWCDFLTKENAKAAYSYG